MPEMAISTLATILVCLLEKVETYGLPNSANRSFPGLKIKPTIKQFLPGSKHGLPRLKGANHVFFQFPASSHFVLPGGANPA
jgi:hypothetical protein